MGRRVDAAQLVGASDIKERLGFPRVQDVHGWRKRDATFPEPVAQIGGGSIYRIMVWYWPEVAAWAKRKGIALSTDGVPAKPTSYRSKEAERQAELDAELARVRAERVQLAELREQLGDIAELRERVDALRAFQDTSDGTEPEQAAGES